MPIDFTLTSYQRRRVHGIIADENFNPRAIMDRRLRQVRQVNGSHRHGRRSNTQNTRDHGSCGIDFWDRSLGTGPFPFGGLGPSTPANRLTRLTSACGQHICVSIHALGKFDSYLHWLVISKGTELKFCYV